jgi:cobalt-zinc-cadmium efflux system outer membrane protein
MRIALWAAVALWLLPRALGAQAPTFPTLSEARARAQQTNPELTAARHAVAAAEGRLKQAGTFLPNPMLFYNREQVSHSGSSSTQDIVGLEQAVEIGGQRAARREAAQAAYDAAQARLATVAARIDHEVANSHATVAALTRRAALAEEAAAAFRRATQISDARLANGDISGYQHRRLLLESARYLALHLEAMTARDSALQTLRTLIGLTDPTVVSPTAGSALTMPAPLDQSPDSLVRLAWSQRPELRVARFEALISTADANLMAADRVPTPTLSAGLKRDRLATGEVFNGFVAGISVPVPLWDRRGGAIAAARSVTAQRDAEFELMRRQTEREVRIAFAAHQSLHEQLTLLAAQLGEPASLARRAAESAFAEGEIGLVEWLDMVRAYQEVETSYTTLWVEYIARRAVLERATGAPLF